jgi:DNA-binding LacI/PurR family transcriptional regulator
VFATSEYDLTIYNVETPQQRNEYFRRVPRRERVDGVIIVSLPPREPDVAYLAQAEVPVVFVDCNVPWLAGFSRVVEDDVAGGQLAVQHLVDLGHRRIAYLSDLLVNPFDFTPSRDRCEGYRRVLEAANIPFRPQYHEQGAHGRAEAHRLARKLLALSERPTAIFAASDTQALGVLEAANELGLRVPQDLSLIGYDDIEVAEYLGLTTVRQMLFESGKRGAELLLGLLHDPAREPVCETSPTHLVIRRTTAPPPHDD